jgi:hypothetical protein
MDQSLGIKQVYKERALPDALTNFQFIEEELKNILICCNEIVVRRMSGVAFYTYSKESILDTPLDNLIKRFKFFCDDDDLMSMLNTLRSRRNTIAHRGYLEIINHENDEAKLRESLNQLGSVIQESEKALHRLQEFHETVKNA